MSRPLTDKGFTLIELILVVAIIGLLASLTLPKFSNMIEKAKEASLKGSLGTLRSALSLYYADNEGVYPRFYKTFPPYDYGIFNLQGKYMDFSRIKFSLPRYAQDATGYSSRSAMQLYSPSDPSENWKWSNYSNINSISHMPWPYPSYSVLHSNAPGVMGSYAEIRLLPVDMVAADLLDLSGRAWSTW